MILTCNLFVAAWEGRFGKGRCTSLTSVTIGNGVTNIGDEASDYGTSLTSAYFQSNAPSADSTVFGSEPATI